ncbi:MAG TPA: hypothetical protein VLM85_01555, partial [Polyangiaceae bacterium]|nr:hypothetical protein [Polyangiaceae bacterium]
GQPTANDLSHTPSDEQTFRTPLPIYVEYTGTESIKKVTLRYKGLGMGEFKPLELKKMGSGYGAEVPCTDVTEGDFKYYIQAYNADGDNVASAGSKNNPYVVKIKKEISSEPPHLPNKPPSKQCKDTSECPEGVAGAECRGESGGGGGNEEGKGAGEACEDDSDCKSNSCKDSKCTAPKLKSAGEDCESADECSSGACTAGKCAAGAKKTPKIFIGLDIAYDLTLVPSAQNVCQIDNTTGAQTSGYGCFDPGNDPGNPSGQPYAGRDYPIDPGENNFSGAGANAGAVTGGLAPGNLRISLTFDYAVTPNILIGAKLGVALFHSPSRQGFMGGGAPVGLLAEGRFNYVIGGITSAVAPFVGIGIGVSQYDAAVTVPVVGGTASPANTPDGNPGPAARNVQAWALGGPFYIAPGGGVRIGLNGGAIGLLLGVRLPIAVGTAFTFSIEPDVGFQYGF